MGSRASARILFLCVGLLLLIPGALLSAEETFLVKKITLSGNKVLSTETLTPIVAPYEGKEMTLSSLQKVGALITEAYQKKGYLIAKAYVPEQEITDGLVRIDILEGTIGEVKVQGSHKYYSTDFIKKHFDPIIKEKALNQNALERALLVLNEYPKLNVQATLQQGETPGTTDILVTAKNSMPINLTLDYNNFGSKYTSRDRFGATFDIGNFLKEGAILSIRGLSGDDPGDMIFGRGSYSIPLNTLGTRLAVYYARGDFDVGEEFAVLDMKGKIESYGFSLTHPFIKKRLQSLTGEFGFDVKDTKQYLLSDLSSYDKIRSVRAGATYEQTGAVGRTYLSLFVTRGLGHVLGGMENDAAFTSRPGADNSFTRLNIDVIRLQRFNPCLFLILKGSGQISPDSLVAGEQISIGGADSVRGFVPGEYSGDYGYSLTAELRVAPLVNKEIFQLAFFMDNGGIWVKEPVVGQSSKHNITGGGGGIRLNLPYDFNIRADVGFPIDPSTNSDGKHVMYYLQAVKVF